MITNKKGLSDVVTTVIIILLVIAAIGIIWSFVQPTLKKAGEQINTECLTVNIEPVSCDISDDKVTFKRNSGEGDVRKVVVLFENNGVTDAREEEAFTSTDPFSVLETEDHIIAATTGVSVGTKIKVAAVVGPSEQVCDASPTVVTCVA